MKASIALALMFLLNVAQEKPKASLEETLSWVKNFTNQHGFMMVDNELLQTMTILGTDGCVIEVQQDFPKASTAKQIKKRTAKIYLAMMDPDDVKMQADHYQGSETFFLRIVRSDAETRIEAQLEMGDGSKTKSWSAEQLFCMDSAENAKRLGNGLSHAIKLCGGKPAPF